MPNPAAVADPADPCVFRNFPPLVLGILGNGDELPDELPGRGVDAKDQTARNMALAERRSDNEHAVVILRVHVVAVPPLRRLLQVGEPRLQDVGQHRGDALVTKTPCTNSPVLASRAMTRTSFAV